jgi:hypothetical protein
MFYEKILFQIFDCQILIMFNTLTTYELTDFTK